MASNDVETINELIEKLRLGEVDGTIEITINNKGKINKVLIKKQGEEGEIAEEIRKIQLKKPNLSNVDFSRTNISGSDLSGVDLHGADFSYSRIENSNLSYTNLQGANLYKTALSQTNLSHAEGINAHGAYLTGSVNLYNVTPSTMSPISNPYDGVPSAWPADDYGEHPMDMGNIMPEQRRRNY